MYGMGINYDINNSENRERNLSFGEENIHKRKIYEYHGNLSRLCMHVRFKLRIADKV